MRAAGSSSQHIPQPMPLPRTPISLERRTAAGGSCDRPNLRMLQTCGPQIIVASNIGCRWNAVEESEWVVKGDEELVLLSNCEVGKVKDLEATAKVDRLKLQLKRIKEQEELYHPEKTVPLNNKDGDKIYPVCNSVVKTDGISLKHSPALELVKLEDLKTSKQASVCVDANYLTD
ncbi:hypothetical protein UY3_05457 [Chelonia mydas]|uniref:Uncharacterized protein n=1 Tax=Chelonia mydas TaxID=8469 RepID=M7C9N9_CHEMY|nr:hypothetical protein UY3_05457 [Chelonia mydas]